MDMEGTPRNIGSLPELMGQQDSKPVVLPPTRLPQKTQQSESGSESGDSVVSFLMIIDVMMKTHEASLSMTLPSPPPRPTPPVIKGEGCYECEGSFVKLSKWVRLCFRGRLKWRNNFP